MRLATSIFLSSHMRVPTFRMFGKNFDLHICAHRQREKVEVRVPPRKWEEEFFLGVGWGVNCSAAAPGAAPTAAEPDRCKCPRCGVALHCWLPRDYPVVAHRQVAPRCAFLVEEGVISRPGQQQHRLCESSEHGGGSLPASVFFFFLACWEDLVPPSV